MSVQQVKSLQRRLNQERAEHAKTVAAKNDEIRALRDTWELFDTFPALKHFFSWLHKIRDAAGPLRSSTYQTGHAAEWMTASERGIFFDPDRSRVTRTNNDIEFWTSQLEERLSPRGRVVDDEVPDVSKPVCENPDCPAKFIPQSFDQEICYECKIPFTEFRSKQVKERCWRRECEPRGHTGPCKG